MNCQNDKLVDLSSAYDGDRVDTIKSEEFRSEKAQEHMQNWSLIADTLRGNCKITADSSFVNKVMAQIDKEPTIKVSANKRVVFDFVKTSFNYISSMAIAAAVAAVTIIGYQTYSASNLRLTEPAGSSSPRASSLNLASYQSNNQDIQLSLNNAKDISKPVKLSDNEYKKLQDEELRKINIMLQGYVQENALLENY